MAKKKELKEQIREILAEDFVGPPSPFQAAMSKAKADWIKNPPGLDSELVGPPLPEPVDAPYGYEKPNPRWANSRFRDQLPGLIPPTMSREELGKDFHTGVALMGVRQEAHPAEGYYGGRLENVIGDNIGSRIFMPDYEGTPLRPAEEFYPPPTISNEEQEMIDAERGGLVDAIERALKESKKKDK